MEEKLAMELLQEIKRQAKRWFIAFVIALIMLFASNIAWLYAWCMPTEESTTTIHATDGSNASYINGMGDILNGGDN